MSIKLLKFAAGGALALAVLFTVGVLWPLPAPTPSPRPDRLLIRDASIIDVVSGEAKAGHSILLEGDRIVAVGPDLRAADAMVIDASGLFAVPGLFDMHMHSFKLSPELMHPMFVAHGVTAVRDMGGCIRGDDSWAACIEDKRRWTQQVARGAMVGPRYDQVTSLAINGGRAMPDSVARDLGDLGAATPAGARLRAAHDAARGADFLKTYTMLPKDSFFALAEAAADKGMYLAGHLPHQISALEAISAGIRSFEHALLFLFECYPDMARHRANPDFWSVYDNTLRLRMIAEHDPAQCEAIFAAMRNAGTAFVPTHTTRKLDAFADNPTYRNDARLKYIPAPLRMMWLEDADNMARRGSGDGAHSYQAVFDFGLQLTGHAHRAGVSVLAGTDAPDSFTFAGASMRDELNHLVQAGLSPLDALRAATLEPARFLGLDGRAGVIRPGARADIVLLRANPLQDIDAIAEVEAVVLAGAPYSRKALDQMLEDVERAANSWSIWPKFAWQIANSPIMRKQFAD